MRAAVPAGPLRTPEVRVQDPPAPTAPPGRERVVAGRTSSINGTDLGFDPVDDVVACGPIDGPLAQLDHQMLFYEREL